MKGQELIDLIKKVGLEDYEIRIYDTESERYEPVTGVVHCSGEADLITKFGHILE